MPSTVSSAGSRPLTFSVGGARAASGGCAGSGLVERILGFFCALPSPKSRRSRRTIDLAPTLRSALTRLSTRFQEGLVFCSNDGKPIDPDNFAHRDWVRVLCRAELRRIRFHDLRHTYASLLIAQEAHPKYSQAQLGHASIQTTLDR